MENGNLVHWEKQQRMIRCQPLLESTVYKSIRYERLQGCRLDSPIVLNRDV